MLGLSLIFSVFRSFFFSYTEIFSPHFSKTFLLLGKLSILPHPVLASTSVLFTLISEAYMKY